MQDFFRELRRCLLKFSLIICITATNQCVTIGYMHRGKGFSSTTIFIDAAIGVGYAFESAHPYALIIGTSYALLPIIFYIIGPAIAVKALGMHSEKPDQFQNLDWSEYSRRGISKNDIFELIGK